MTQTPVAPKMTALRKAIAETALIEVSGLVTQVVGLVIEANGPNARLGDLCLIHTEGGTRLQAEVVGFRGDRILLMPLGEMSGVRAGCRVDATRDCLKVAYGSSLLGRVLDGLGAPIDGLGPLEPEGYSPVVCQPPNAMDRPMIKNPMPTGVRAIDGLLTLGEGQRMGIFSGSGIGKSTLLGMIARNCQADVNVIALIGERGREVQEFIKNDLGPTGFARSVVVCATSEQPALVRIKGALTATAIAEGFRNQGKSVLLMMDSVTRFAMAQREVGLAIGEPPSTKGYTPSVFALLPKLMERAGTSPRGSITGLYTVLVEGDDTNEPISDAARAILDGHIILSRKLTSRGHYPPIDVIESLSRVMPMVVDEEQVLRARETRELLAAYDDIEDLVNIGAYKTGAKPVADRALALNGKLNAFLRQNKSEGSGFDATNDALKEILGEEVHIPA